MTGISAGGAWSKTMVGYQKEDTNFALELTVSDSYLNHQLPE